MTPVALDVIGIGLWAVGLDGWPALRDALADPAATLDAPCMQTLPHATRPPLTMLPAAERRRTPDGVAVAIHVARQATTAAAGLIDPTALASVFASAHGDLAIVDYLCATLASDPAALSPTRFHLSVHNAAAGYWSIAMRDHAPTTATAAGDDSFALGLLEAATLAVAESRPVLLVAFDTRATGLLAAAVPNRALFGFAMVLRPPDAAWHGPHLSLEIEPVASVLPLPLDARLHRLASSSPSARALTLAEALATGSEALVRHPIRSGTTLAARVTPARS
jgi:hypothetical protein